MVVWWQQASPAQQCSLQWQLQTAQLLHWEVQEMLWGLLQVLVGLQQQLLQVQMQLRVAKKPHQPWVLLRGLLVSAHVAVRC